MKILLVEDNGYTRETIKKGLLNDGIASMQEIFEAFNGLEGVRLYKEQLPDVVLMDINMPELNGYDACMQILDVNPNAHVIFVSHDKSPDAPDQAIRVGGIKFFSKPVQTNKINSFIQSLEIKPQKIQDSLADEEETFFLEEPTETFELLSSEATTLSNDDDFGQPIITSEEIDFFEFEDSDAPVNVNEKSSIEECIEAEFIHLDKQPISDIDPYEVDESPNFEDDFFAGLEPTIIENDTANILTNSESEIKQEAPLQTEDITEQVISKESDSIESSIEEDFFGEDFMFKVSDDINVPTDSSTVTKPSTPQENSIQLEDDFFSDTEAEESIDLSNVDINENDVSTDSIDSSDVEFENIEIPSPNILDTTVRTSASNEHEQVILCEGEGEEDEEISFQSESNITQTSPSSDTLITDMNNDNDDEDDEFDLGDEGFDIDDGFDLGEDGFTTDEDELPTSNTSDENYSAFHNPAQRKQTIIKRVPLTESKKEELSKTEHHVVYEKDLESSKPVNIKPPRTNLLASDTSLPLEEPIMNPSNDIIIDNTNKNAPKVGLLSKVKSIFSGKRD